MEAENGYGRSDTAMAGKKNPCTEASAMHLRESLQESEKKEI